jgi:hypothetical protein
VKAAEERALADRAAILAVEVAALETKKAELDALKAQLRGLRPKVAAGEGFQVDGNKYVAQVGPMGNERLIRSMKAVAEAIGLTSFLENCSFTLKKLDQLAADPAALVSVARTGTRPVQFFLKGKK